MVVAWKQHSMLVALLHRAPSARLVELNNQGLREMYFPWQYGWDKTGASDVCS